MIFVEKERARASKSVPRASKSAQELAKSVPRAPKVASIVLGGLYLVASGCKWW